MTAPRFRTGGRPSQPWPLAMGGSDPALVAGAEAAAEAAVDAVLEVCQRGEPAILVEAPAGAGKTQLVRDLAALEVANAQGRVLVACATQAQARTKTTSKSQPRSPPHHRSSTTPVRRTAAPRATMARPDSEPSSQRVRAPGRRAGNTGSA